MTSRPWPWLRDLITGLITRPTSLDPHGYPVYANRVQQSVLAPRVADHQHAAQQ